MEPIEIKDYDPQWPAQFADIARRVHAAFAGGLRITVEHVGSTSVVGLAAKPMIDLNVVVPTREDIPDAIARLATLGYVHQGNLGISGREAFRSPLGLPPHHLYLCAGDNAEHRRQIAFRDYLRANGDIAGRYADLKRTLAVQHGSNRTAYSEAKTEFIETTLQQTQGSAYG